MQRLREEQQDRMHVALQCGPVDNEIINALDLLQVNYGSMHVLSDCVDVLIATRKNLLDPNHDGDGQYPSDSIISRSTYSS